MEPIDPNIIQLWWHYEEIAMHFNELIIQYRLQVIGGAGVIGTLAAYIVGKVENVERRHKIRAYVSPIILILLTSAAYLDIFYYNLLLQGAVKAILRLEEQYPYLYMSTEIAGMYDESSRFIVGSVYLGIIILLSLFTIWTWIMVYVEKKN